MGSGRVLNGFDRDPIRIGLWGESKVWSLGVQGLMRRVSEIKV